jgi:CheY-like chemotaxis protein
LLINSSKYAGTGEATVTLEHQAHELRIEVRDEGAGLASAATAADDRALLSSGFGLLSIHERMNALGGSLEMDSVPGKGVTATLRLPLHTVAPERAEPQVCRRSGCAEPPPSSGARPSKPRGKWRVLLVDDHAMVRQGLRTVLDGYADVEVVGEASNGEEAVRRVSEWLPSIVVMDINMPTMNGIEATAAITARYPDIRVIGLSVNAGEENRAAMQQAGATLLLTKEVAVDQLYVAIQQAVSSCSER